MLKFAMQFLKKLFSSYKFWLISLIICVALFGTLLSFPRYAQADETIYLLEAGGMASVLTEGQWFGNQPVSWHGFLFKMPAVFLFMLFGRSIFAATATNIVFAALATLLAFNFFKIVLKSNWWSLAATFLVVTNYTFVQSTPTFLREIPLLISCLIVFTVLAKQKNKWLIGLAMLLLLDAKEGVFYAFVPALLAWILFSELNLLKYQLTHTGTKAKAIYHSFTKMFERSFALLFPAFVWLTLMFCTSIIPLNMRNANILCLTTSRANELRFNFALKRAVDKKDYHQKTSKNRPVNVRPIQKEPTILPESTTNMASKIQQSALWPFSDRLELYSYKAFCTRAFSLISAPKSIVIPAIFVTLLAFFWFPKKRHASLLPLILICWCYLAIYILRISNGRYLMPILPLLVLFFIEFLRQMHKHLKTSAVIIVFCGVCIALTMRNDSSYLLARMLINPIIMLLMITALLSHWRFATFQKHALILLILAIGIATSGSALASSYKIGQIKNWQKYGLNQQIPTILDEIDFSKKTAFINIQETLIMFYRNQRPNSDEGTWHLQNWIPKKWLLEINSHPFCFLRYYYYNHFKQKCLDHGVEQIVIVDKGYTKAFPRLQNLIEICKESEEYSLTKELDLKGKTVYIFEIL